MVSVRSSLLLLLASCLAACATASAAHGRRAGAQPITDGRSSLLDAPGARAGRSLLQRRPSMNPPIFSDMERGGGYTLQSRQYTSGTRMQAPAPSVFRGRSGLMLAPSRDGRRLAAATATGPSQRQLPRGPAAASTAQQHLALATFGEELGARAGATVHALAAALQQQRPPPRAQHSRAQTLHRTASAWLGRWARGGLSATAGTAPTAARSPRCHRKSLSVAAQRGVEAS